MSSVVIRAASHARSVGSVGRMAQPSAKNSEPYATSPAYSVIQLGMPPSRRDPSPNAISNSSHKETPIRLRPDAFRGLTTEDLVRLKGALVRPNRIAGGGRIVAAYEETSSDIVAPKRQAGRGRLEEQPRGNPASTRVSSLAVRDSRTICSPRATWERVVKLNDAGRELLGAEEHELMMLTRW